MRISDWSSDVCSSDLAQDERRLRHLRLGFGPYGGVERAERVRINRREEAIHVEVVDRVDPEERIQAQLRPQEVVVDLVCQEAGTVDVKLVAAVRDREIGRAHV